MKVSFVVPTYCEAENIESHYKACMAAFDELCSTRKGTLSYEYLIIDNCSPDETVSISLRLRAEDNNIKILVNDRNYGAVLSPFHGLMAATGDVALLIAADLQEPPHILTLFMSAIDEGYEVAIGYKQASSENILMWKARGMYYRLLSALMASGVPPRYSGFGLYSRSFIEKLRLSPTSEPSLRVLLPKIAATVRSFPYEHLERHRGRSTYSLYSYTREAVKNLARNSGKFPSLAGKLASLLACLAIALVPITIFLKVVNWNSLGPGITTLILVILIISSLLFGFIAIVIDRLDLILGRLSPPAIQVRQSATYL